MACTDVKREKAVLFEKGGDGKVSRRGKNGTRMNLGGGSLHARNGV